AHPVLALGVAPHHPVHRRAQRPARDYPAGRAADVGRDPGDAVHAEGHRPSPGVRATGGVAIDSTLLGESVRFAQELFVWQSRLDASRSPRSSSVSSRIKRRYAATGGTTSAPAIPSSSSCTAWSARSGAPTATSVTRPSHP